jgi:hypothetical protein
MSKNGPTRSSMEKPSTPLTEVVPVATPVVTHETMTGQPGGGFKVRVYKLKKNLVDALTVPLGGKAVRVKPFAKSDRAIGGWS